MFYGVFYPNEDIEFIATLHRFESGQKYSGVVKIHIAVMGDDFSTADEYSMTLMDSETGLYHYVLAAETYGVGLYYAVIEANIDLVYGWQRFVFRIENKSMWLLGAF